MTTHPSDALDLVTYARDWLGAIESPTARSLVKMLADSLEGIAQLATANQGAIVDSIIERSQGEPSDAQVEAAAEVIAVANGDGPWGYLDDTFQDEYRHAARAALRAAREAMDG